ncbi:MAG: NAD(P)H-dependent oxidoreductase subunit E [Phycisphaerae bacterium]
MASLNNTSVVTVVQRQLLDRLVAAHRGKPGAVLAILEALQQSDPHNYLPRALILATARALRLPLAQMMSVVSFYSFFNQTPQGDHTVTICRGTACHTRGSRILLDTLRGTLDFAEPPSAETEPTVLTTRDNKVTLRTVACFGQCAMAPVVDLDHTICGHMNRQKVLAAVEKLQR